MKFAKSGARLATEKEQGYTQIQHIHILFWLKKNIIRYFECVVPHPHNDVDFYNWKIETVLIGNYLAMVLHIFLFWY